MLQNNREITEKKYYVILGAALLALLSIASTTIAAMRYDALADIAALRHPRDHAVDIPEAYRAVKLRAKAAYVEELATGRVLYRFNAETPLPLASLTKLMTALVAGELLDPSAIVTVTAADLTPGGDAVLQAGTRWRFSVLRDLMLVASSNAAAHTLARSATVAAGPVSADSAGGRFFVARMNAAAQVLGLARTVYANPTGLDIVNPTNTIPLAAGASGSAHDMAQLLSYLYEIHPDILAKTMLPAAGFSMLNGQMIRVKNTDTALGAIPDVVASKTGYTDLAGGNLAIILNIKPNDPFVIVVLGSSEKGRFSDAKTLVAATRATLGIVQK